LVESVVVLVVLGVVVVGVAVLVVALARWGRESGGGDRCKGGSSDRGKFGRMKGR
jgi:hypothetical protein